MRTLTGLTAPEESLLTAQGIASASNLKIMDLSDLTGPSDRNYLLAPAEPSENWRVIFYLPTFLLFVQEMTITKTRVWGNSTPITGH